MRCKLLICVLSSSPPLLTGIFREFLSDFFAEISFFPVQFSRCGGLSPLSIAAALFAPSDRLQQPPAGVCSASQLFEVSQFLANPQNDTDKRFSQTLWLRFRFASAIIIGLTAHLSIRLPFSVDPGSFQVQAAIFISTLNSSLSTLYQPIDLRSMSFALACLISP